MLWFTGCLDSVGWADGVCGFAVVDLRGVLKGDLKGWDNVREAVLRRRRLVGGVGEEDMLSFSFLARCAGHWLLMSCWLREASNSVEEIH